jgi:photosystem II stability/assembly factor-like uncharacterized protein
MKNVLFFSAFIVIAGLIFTLNKSANYTFRQGYATRNKVQEPYDQMNFQRSYPYDKFDVPAYNAAMHEAQGFGRTRASGNWEVAGPLNINGRVNSVVVDPANSNIIYAGTSFGGVFKTINGGTNWTPLFDDQPNLPIGDIILDPNNSSNVWVGTGDKNISGTCYVGGGIYLSTDAGSSWVNKGLSNTYVISSVLIDPSNSNTIYAGTMGNPFDADNNRGLYKSTDGGTSWNNVLFINDSTGVVDLIMDPNDPNTLYATSFTRMRTSTRSTYHSDQCKIYKTTNAGTTWTILTGGLPTGDVGRIGVSISATNSNVLYAIVASTSSYVEGIYKSTNAGVTWTPKSIVDLETIGTCYGGFGWYFGKIHINPSNDNIIYTYGVDKFISYDGGDNWNLFAPEWWMYEVHADGHDLEFIDDQKMILATDGGLYKTVDNGITWTDIDNMPSTQFYRVTHLPGSAEKFYGGAQDNGTIGGTRFNSTSWYREFGGDGFKFYASPLDTLIRYYETQWAGIYFDDHGFQNSLDAGLTGAERFNWNSPYMLDRFDPTIVYLGAENVFEMTGAPYGTFSPISSDLTDGPILSLGGGNTISAMSQSYFDQGTIFVGTTDANVWVTTTGGGSWNSINLGLPNRYVTSMNTSPNVNGNVYISFSGYRMFDNTPHIYKSTNNGASWTSIQGDLPNFAVNDIMVMPGDENNIMVGTDAGVYQSLDGGTTWLRLGNGMPQVAVLELELNESATVLSAATFGRGIMVLDLNSLSIGENKNQLKISAYPNPCTDFIFVEGLQSNAQCKIFDLNGKLILSKAVIGQNLSINLKSIEAGTYILSLNVNGKSSSQKIIKR